MAKTAAALVVGNEILTGKVEEQNVAFLARALFSAGVTLRRVVVCPDEIDVIVRDLNELRATHDAVVTSGGIGPTHDDVTVDAVAAAFGVPLARSAEVEQMIRRYWGDRTTEHHLRMANVPEGAELVRNAEVPWPTLVMDNVFVLPGVPEIFQLKLGIILARLRGDAPFTTHAVYTRCDEGTIADLLARLAADYPDVTIGSYLKWRDPDYKLKLTFDGSDAARVMRAADALVAAIPGGDLVRRE